MTSNRMKAIVYEKNRAQNVLALQEVDKPLPQDDEVLVRIHASSVNTADYRSLRMGIIPKRKIFGGDIAGRVEATGKNAQKFKIGDAVFGDISGCGFGGFAEYVSVPENVLALKPASVSFEDAATVPLAGITALQALRDKGGIQPGHRVLIYGAGGGVGTFAIQLAKNFGAEVTAVCSTQNVELARSLGADHAIDYTKEDILRGASHFDLILGVNGNHPLSAYRRALTPKGVFVMVGGALTQVIKTLLFGAFMSIGGRKMRFLAAKPNVNDLSYLINLVKEGKIRPVIDRRYPLEETAEAMRYVSAGHARGKVIIAVARK
jgi:NADPH:quinone reductase-like Zn-dependent oxidoreductase